MNDCAPDHVRTLVIANPNNTLTSVLALNATRIPDSQFTSLSRLDQNRARAVLATKCHVSYNDVRNAVVWGNHSETQCPDADFCTIQGLPAKDFIKDKKWLEEQYVNTIANRAFEILAYRGKTSMMSCAKSIADHLRDWHSGSNEYAVMGRVSDGNMYGIDKGLTFAVPNVCVGNFELEIPQLKVSEFTRKKMDISHLQLRTEWAKAQELIKEAEKV